MKLFLTIFAATIVLGPAFAVAFFLLGGFGLSNLLGLQDGVVIYALARARVDVGPLIMMSYLLGALPAAAGGAYLGWRFTRTPAELGPAEPLVSGVALGVALALFLTLPPNGSHTPMTVAAVVIALSVTCAAACWAIARLIYRAMGPGHGVSTAARETGR